MQIILNGEKTELKNRLSLMALVRAQGMDPDAVVAEVNLKVIPGCEWENYMIENQDRIELLSFVGGG
jgi:sulfur carrier protein